jgi:FAD synthase
LHIFKKSSIVIPASSSFETNESPAPLIPKTLNIFLKDKKQIQFKEGVYVSLCVLNNIIFNSVTCIFKPTVKNGQLIETNIIVDYPKGYNAYGKEIKVMLISYLTPFIKFKHRNDLKKYISDNVKLTKKYFGI